MALQCRAETRREGGEGRAPRRPLLPFVHAGCSVQTPYMSVSRICGRVVRRSSPAVAATPRTTQGNTDRLEVDIVDEATWQWA